VFQTYFRIIKIIDILWRYDGSKRSCVPNGFGTFCKNKKLNVRIHIKTMIDADIQ